MSAAAHRAEAERERDAARAALAAVETRLPGEVQLVPGSLTQRGPWIDPHPEAEKREGPPVLEAAVEHSRHARAHERAAVELERVENAECRGLPAETRAACPLLHDVVTIDNVRGGVRVRFAKTVSVPDTVAHIRCHLAYARARAFADADDCPLYVRGVEVASDGPHAVRLTSADAERREVVTRIRQLARKQALPATKTK